MKNLVFVSCIVFVLTSCQSYVCKDIKVKNFGKQRVVYDLMDTCRVKKFKARINYKETEITGILICKKLNDSTLTGGLINEFGIKGFDFTITKQRAKLGFVFANIDKWYIRRQLEADLHFIFYRPVLNTTCSVNDSSVYVANIKRTVVYTYNLFNNTKLKRADMYNGSTKIATMQHMTDSVFTIRMNHVEGLLRYEFCEITN